MISSRVMFRGALFSGSMKRICSAMLVAVFFVSSLMVVVPSASAVYTGEDIGCAGYWEVIPTGINDADQVSAWRYLYSNGSIQDAAVYDRETGMWTVLPPAPDGGDYVGALDINNDGEVVGLYHVPWSHKGIYWPASYDKAIVLESLGTFYDIYSEATDLNDLHEAVGHSWGVGGLHRLVQWNLDPDAASIEPLEIGYVEGMDVIIGQDINNNHAIVGHTYNSTNIDPQGFYCAGYGHEIQLLPHLSAGGIDGPCSRAYAISDSGMAIGMSTDLAGISHAVVWQPPYSAAPIDLGPVVGVPSVAYDISTDEKIVGSRGAPDQAFVYGLVSGVFEILPTPSGMSFSYASGVNDVGHVVGHGFVTPPTETDYGHAVLWTPDTPPVAAFTASVSGLTVTVDASASYDHEGEIVDYAWDFGDGEYGLGMTANHTYATDGPYTIVLTVTDSVGQTDSLSLIISAYETPKAELVELIALIEECTSFDEDIKDRLTTKVSNALDLIEARKSHGDGVANILLAINNMVSNYVLVGKIASEYEAWDIEAQINFVISLLAENHMVAGVPIYTWYHGCGPTAAGMLMGYWDAVGFGDLVKGPQGSELFQSAEVNAMIASESHIADYVYPLDGWVEQPNGTEIWVDLQPDKSELGGATDDDCLADFMHTSRSADGLVYGQSYVDMVDDALVGYTTWASGGRYVADASLYHQGSMSWGDLQVQVNAARPMVFVVDWNGDGESDHLVTVVGYCEIGNAQLYAFYSTWDDNVWWALFDIMKEGNFYGVFAATTFSVANTV